MNVPKLRFKGFNAPYRTILFGDLVTNKSDKYNPLLNKQSFKCIELEHMESNTGSLNGFTDSKLQASIKNVFNPNSVLYGKLRPYLNKFYYTDFSGVCSSEIWVLSSLDNNKLINPYLYYLIQTSKYSNLVAQSTGSKMPRADWTILSETDFEIPVIEEQNKISSFLKKVDVRIKLQQEKINLLKEQKKGFMQKIFKTPNNSLRDIYYLSQLGNFYKGHTLAKQDLSDSGLPCVLYGHLYTEYNEVISSVKYKTANTNGFPGVKGDLLIPSSGETAIDIARTATLQENALLGGDLTILRVDPQIVDSVYLSYLINAKYKHTLAKFAQGASVVHLYSSEIKRLAIELPTIEQQNKIGSFLLKIDKKIQLEESKKHALLIQKQAFLQKMFI
ncbi:restriction endonuclease subunit S [Solibacillus sp. FSL W7-1324]|uniref:restriction endonuclease subunit S n=1 Tax=Solibacillus sp. FSL W7-1324 TaxID=2921701 RepID=UPI0030F79D42